MGKSLGMAVEVWNDAGQPVIAEKGELVCTRHFPAMPIGLWNDADGSRLRQSYFSLFPGVWAQGDYAEQLPNGGMMIHGRSDAVLNPGGVRISRRKSIARWIKSRRCWTAWPSVNNGKTMCAWCCSCALQTASNWMKPCNNRFAR